MIDNKCIEVIINILKKNNYKYFSKGIYILEIFMKFQIVIRLIV